MKIHEDRSHMNIDTRWFEKGYIKEDVHSLRLQSLCTEAGAAANKQFTTATPAKNGISISAKQVWRAAQQ